MIKRRLSLVVACVLLSFGSCRGYQSPFSPPGTMQQQRLNASVYDPYADNDAGPEIVGGRPRDYQKPWSEADRSRASVGGWTRQPAPPSP